MQFKKEEMKRIELATRKGMKKKQLPDEAYDTIMKNIPTTLNAVARDWARVQLSVKANSETIEKIKKIVTGAGGEILLEENNEIKFRLKKEKIDKNLITIIAGGNNKIAEYFAKYAHQGGFMHETKNVFEQYMQMAQNTNLLHCRDSAASFELQDDGEIKFTEYFGLKGYRIIDAKQDITEEKLVAGISSSSIIYVDNKGNVQNKPSGVVNIKVNDKIGDVIFSKMNEIIKPQLPEIVKWHQELASFMGKNINKSSSYKTLYNDFLKKYNSYIKKNGMDNDAYNNIKKAYGNFINVKQAAKWNVELTDSLLDIINKKSKHQPGAKKLYNDFLKEYANLNSKNEDLKQTHANLKSIHKKFNKLVEKKSRKNGFFTMFKKRNKKNKSTASSTKKMQAKPIVPRNLK